MHPPVKLGVAASAGLVVVDVKGNDRRHVTVDSLSLFETGNLTFSEVATLICDIVSVSEDEYVRLTDDDWGGWSWRNEGKRARAISSDSTEDMDDRRFLCRGFLA
jgi:hypothetical protein